MAPLAGRTLTCIVDDARLVAPYVARHAAAPQESAVAEICWLARQRARLVCGLRANNGIGLLQVRLCPLLLTIIGNKCVCVQANSLGERRAQACGRPRTHARTHALVCPAHASGRFPQVARIITRCLNAAINNTKGLCSAESGRPRPLVAVVVVVVVAGGLRQAWLAIVIGKISRWLRAALAFVLL